MKAKFSTKIHSQVESRLKQRAVPQLKKVIARALPKVAARVAALVSSEARRVSPSAGDAYEKALKSSNAITLTSDSVIIQMKDPVAVAREHGMPAHDMKLYLLKHGKVGKNGSVYVDIPLSHNAASVPKAIRTALKKVSRVRMVTKGKTFKKTLNGKKVTVKHARGIHDDMMRRGGSYKTIRRVSTNSPATSWWHPGFKGLNIFKKNAVAIRKEASAIIANELNVIGNKVTTS